MEIANFWKYNFLQCSGQEQQNLKRAHERLLHQECTSTTRAAASHNYSEAKIGSLAIYSNLNEVLVHPQLHNKFLKEASYHRTLLQWITASAKKSGVNFSSQNGATTTLQVHCQVQRLNMRNVRKFEDVYETVATGSCFSVSNDRGSSNEGYVLNVLKGLHSIPLQLTRRAYESAEEYNL